AEFLQKCPLFAAQPADMLANCAERMKRESFAPEETIIGEREIGDKFSVIESGSVEVSGIKEGLPFAGIALGVGDFFGEVELLTGTPRNATVVAREPVTLFTLAKEHFDSRSVSNSSTIFPMCCAVCIRRKAAT